MHEILDNRGKVVSGPLSFYALPNGITIFCEDVETDEHGMLTFNMSKTAVIQIQEGPEGVPQFAAALAIETPMFMEANIMKAHSMAVCNMNSFNVGLYKMCREVVNPSKLIKGPRR